MSKKKENDFEQLLIDLEYDVREEDLKLLVDAKLDLTSKMYMWIFGFILPVTVFFVTWDWSEGLALDSKILGWTIIVCGFLVFMLIVRRLQPFKDQIEIMKNYIKARNNLRKHKLSSSSTSEGNSQIIIQEKDSTSFC